MTTFEAPRGTHDILPAEQRLWGLVTGERAQRRMGRLGLAFALVLSLVGINAMLAFVGRGINPFPKTHVTEATVALPPAAANR